MDRNEIAMIVEKQREYFSGGATLPVSFRIEMLKKLKVTQRLMKSLKKRGMQILMRKESPEIVKNRT